MNEYRCYLNEEGLSYLVKEKEVACNGRMDSPEEVIRFVDENYQLTKRAEEYVYLIATTTKLDPIAVFELSHGSINGSLAEARDVFIKLLLCGAVSFLLVHNHPSGDPSPSAYDEIVTKKIKQGADLLNLYFADHIIVSRSGTYSFRLDSKIFE